MNSEPLLKSRASYAPNEGRFDNRGAEIIGAQSADRVIVVRQPAGSYYKMAFGFRGKRSSQHYVYEVALFGREKERQREICKRERERERDFVEPLSISGLQTHPSLHSPVWVGQTAVIPSESVQNWVCLFLYGWYYACVRLQIRVCFF